MAVRGKFFISGIVSLGLLTSCASVKKETLKKELSKVNPPKAEDIFTKEKPILKMNIGNVLYKQDSLNHKLSYNPEVDFVVSKKPIYLKDISFSVDDQIIDIPVKVEDEVAYEIIPPITLYGKLSDVLEQIAVLTNSYWSYENGIIVFKRYKTVVYRLPYEPFEKLNLVYNIGQDSNEQINLSQIKQDLFDELTQVAKAILEDRFIEGEIKRQINIKSGDIKAKKDEIQKSDKVAFEDSKNIERYKDTSFEDGKSKILDQTNLTTKEKGIEKESGIEKKPNTGRSKNQTLDENEVLTDLSKNKEDKKSELSEKDNKVKKARELTGWKRNTLEKKDEANIQDKVIHENKENRKEVSDEEKIQITRKIQKPENPAIASKEAGILIARVSRYNEKALDNAIKQTIKKNLSELVMLDVYIMETNFSDIRSVSTQLAGLLRNKTEETSMEVNGNTLTLSFNGLATSLIDLAAQTEGLANGTELFNSLSKGINISALASYLISKGKGKILANPSIVVMPNHIAKVSSTVKVPYIEPQNISVGGTDAQLSYQIKSIDDGISLIALPIPVSENSILLSLAIKVNRYLGDKQVNAGTLGTITVPIQSPRDLRTSLRLKAGNVFILGGIKQRVVKRDDNRLYGIIPTNDSYENSDKNLLILGKVRLIKFEEE